LGPGKAWIDVKGAVEQGHGGINLLFLVGG
jgi:hypothetical protein